MLHSIFINLKQYYIDWLFNGKLEESRNNEADDFIFVECDDSLESFEELS